MREYSAVQKKTNTKIAENSPRSKIRDDSHFLQSIGDNDCNKDQENDMGILPIFFLGTKAVVSQAH